MQPTLNLFLLIALIISSCGTNNQKQETKTETHISSGDTTLKVDSSLKQLATKAPPSSTDTLSIDQKTAVLYQPDSLQMEKRMKQVGEEDFRAGADDYIYYMNTSAEYLQKQGIPVLDAKNRKYLKFVMADRKVQLIKLDTLQELWGIYLFDPMKKPHYADIIDMETDYKNYFK